MDDLTFLYAFAIVISLLLVFAALRWARTGFARLVIIGLFVLLLPVAYAAPASLLGKAKPVTLQWVNTEVPEAEVLSATMVENEAIFLTLMWQAEPSLYKLPWDQQTAQQLQDAMKQAERNGTNPVMRLPFEPSWDRDEPRFYALPQPKMPEKPREAPSHREFDHPGRSA